MNRKTKYLIPAFAAVFALMFVAAAPHVVAEPGAEKGAWHEGKKAMWKDGAKHHKKHMAVEVEGFVGTIPVPEDVDRETHKALKDQVTVSLSEAAQGLDVMKGSIGIAVNENGEKFVVWTLASMDHDEESDTMTATIYIVDAADAENTATVTKEFDPSKKYGMHGEYGKDRMHGDYDAKLANPEQLENKIQKLEQIINEGTGDSESDQLKVEFIYLLRQLQTAITDGDDAQADSLRDQLKELRNQMIDLKRFK